jgi:hypothetical protein
MDAQNLVAAITACLSPDISIRKAGEVALKQVGYVGQQLIALAVWTPTRLSAMNHQVLVICWQFAVHLDMQQPNYPGGLASLLAVALDTGADIAIRQVAAITLKNAVKRGWEATGAVKNIHHLLVNVSYVVALSLGRKSKEIE